jgi:hypothetical protein
MFKFRRDLERQMAEDMKDIEQAMRDMEREIAEGIKERARHGIVDLVDELVSPSPPYSPSAPTAPERSESDEKTAQKPQKGVFTAFKRFMWRLVSCSSNSVAPYHQRKPTPHPKQKH